MKTSVLLLVCLGILISTVNAENLGSLFISNSPSVHKVLEGEDLQIDCSVNQTDDTIVFWVKNDSSPIIVQNDTTLAFENINRSFSGIYICYSHNLTSDDNATLVEAVKVDVLYPAEIVEFSISQTVVNESSDFEVSCNFSGNPYPDYIIRSSNLRAHPDYIIRSTLRAPHGSVKTIDRVRAECEDQGTWLCTGRNVLNKRNVTRSGYITVFCRPHPRNYYMVENKYEARAQLGTSARFVMKNYANPPATYNWSRNGGQFPMSSQEDFKDGYIGGSILRIYQIKVEDFGTYYLDMSNAYGSDHRNYELIAVGPPVGPKSVTYSDVTYNSAKLHWISGFNGGSQQFFTVLQLVDENLVAVSSNIYEVTGNGVGKHYEYLLTDLDPNTEYTFTIQADNNHEYQPVLAYESAIFFTKYAPWQTTTAYPFFADCCTVGVIVGASLGGLGLLGVLIGLILIIVMRQKRNSFSSLNGRAHQYKTPPLQLSITPEMMKKNEQ